MQYTLKQLAVFVAVGRSISVSAAAAKLSLSQSAVSTALAAFEQQFDQPLFDRIGKTLKINDRGRFLMPHAVALLDQAQDFEAMLLNEQAVGALKIGATLTIGNYLGPHLAVDFLQRYPGSHIDLEVHNTRAIIDGLLAYELDIGLVEGNCSHPDLHVLPWLSDELVVFAAPDHALAQKSAVVPEDLRHQAWILRERGSGTRGLVDSAFSRVGVALQVRLELEHTEAIKRAVEFGLGVGCLSRLALRDAFRRGSLVAIECPALDLRRNFLFVNHRQKYSSVALRAFIALCEELSSGVVRADLVRLAYVA